MLERPGANVRAESSIESLLAEHLVAEQLHHQGRLLIATPEEIADFHRLLDQRLLITGLRVVGVEVERMHLDRVTVWRTGEIFRGAGEIDERVEAFVHPRIQPLVRADDHRKPFVAELVRQRPLLVLAGGTVGHEGEHRVLHPLDRTLDCGGVRVRIGIPLFAEILDRLARHADRLLPLVRARPIQRLDEDAVVAGRVPTKVGSGREGKIAHTVGGEAPGEATLRRGTRLFGMTRFVLGDDRDGRLRATRNR